MKGEKIMIRHESALQRVDEEEVYNEEEHDTCDHIEDEHPCDVVDRDKEDTNNDFDMEKDTFPVDDIAILEDLINTLPEDFLAAHQRIKDEIAPLLVRLDESLKEYFIEKMTKQLKVSKVVIRKEVDRVKGDIAKQALEEEKQSIDPAIQIQAEEIAKNPLLFKTKISLIKDLGVIGEGRNIGMYFLALDSRLLPNTAGSSQVLALKNAGTSGAGKSYPLSKCLEIYPKNAYHLILGGSPKSLYFVEGGLKHTCLVVAEAFSFQNGNTTDSEFALVVRSILSEGEATYQYFSYDDEGNRVAKIQHMTGPTSLITTSIYGKLESQFENRLLTIHPDVSMNQTKKIITVTAQQSSGLKGAISQDVIESWKVFHGMLQPYDVVIPFARNIAEFVINFEGLPLSMRRSFKRVMSTIKTVTTIHQFQREKDDRGRLIATMEDYFMAHQLVNESFRESLGEDKRLAERMEVIRKNQPISSTVLSALFGISGPAVSTWVKDNVEKGILVWCDEDGDLFPDEITLEKEKRKGKALLKIAHMPGLPTPYEITGDPDWDAGGDLYKRYELGLEETLDHKVPLHNKQFNEKINTVKDEKIPDSKGFPDEKDEDVKVLSDFGGLV
jgi:DNA primase